MGQLKGVIKDPGSKLFPDAPEEPLPPSLSPSRLVGTYYNKGYGNLTFRTEERSTGGDGDGADEKETLLIADRPDTTWKYSLVLSHVSGDYWAATFSVKDTPYLVSFAAAEFKMGVDGEAASLEIDMKGPLQPKSEGLFVYERID
jgi:hypothetical protein